MCHNESELFQNLMKSTKLSFFFLTLIDCAPSFTSSPNNGNPVYHLQGNNVNLSWFYNPDGKTVDDIEWSFNAIELIATKFSNGAIEIETAYQNRVEVSGDATIKLLNIQEKDSGKYECRVSFNISNPRPIIDEAQLVVVCKLLHLYFLFKLHCPVRILSQV